MLQFLGSFHGQGPKRISSPRRQDPYLSGEMVIVGIQVDEVSWYKSKAAVFLNGMIKVLQQAFQMTQQGRVQPCDMTPGHRWRRGALFSLRAGAKKKNSTET